MDSKTPRSPRLVLAAISAALVAVPFFFVRFPPSTDLPQHLAQVRLLFDVLANADGPYQIQWWTPYSLVYAILAGTWQIFGPLDAGRAGLVVLGMLWTLAAHGLAAARGRSASAAVLASVLFFGPILYWGFLSFAVGWPAFALWLLLTTRGDNAPFRWEDAVLYFGVALLLYVAHVLWFGMGLLWLVVHTVLHRLPPRVIVARILSVLPIVAGAAIWYPQLGAKGFTSPPYWVSTPIGHLSFSWLGQSAAGGLHGGTKYAVLAAITGWMVVGLWQHREDLTQSSDRALLWAGTLLGTMAVVLPYSFMNTIQFGERWVGPALVLLLLGAPAPRLARLRRRALALVMLGVFVVWTTVAWVRFEQTELSGLGDALAALPPGPRVIGLDFLQTSSMIDYRPFLQIFAYAQVFHGGELNFSFANFAPSPVVYKTVPSPQWTLGLEWNAWRIRREDFQLFDFALIGSRENAHAAEVQGAALEPRTNHGLWRLYQVRREPH